MSNENQELSVSEVMLMTAQKRGTVEYFRRALKAKGLIKNNRSMSPKEVECLKTAILHKNANKCSWVLSVDKAISQAYPDSARSEPLINTVAAYVTKYCEFTKHIEGECVLINPVYVESVEEYSSDASTIIMRSGKVHTVSGDTHTVRDILLDKNGRV